jgi:hypothetical protein
MVKVLTIGPDSGYPTDGMISLGVHAILGMAFPGYSFRHAVLFNDEKNRPTDFYSGEGFDLVVQCGSPFLWDQMEKSVKWDNLQLCRSVHSSAKFVMMGIGSCYPIGFTPSALPDEVSEFFSSSLILVRDRLAHSLVDNSFLLPCPAFYSMLPSSLPKGPRVAVWYDPRVGVAGCDWQDAGKFDSWVNVFKGYIFLHGVRDIYYVDECEFPGEIFGEGYNYIRLRSPSDVIEMIDGCSGMLSGRVHCAIPGLAAGRDVLLQAVDSRGGSFYDFISFNRELEFLKYVSLLRGFYEVRS